MKKLLVIRIKDNGTSRTISWGIRYKARRKVRGAVVSLLLLISNYCFAQDDVNGSKHRGTGGCSYGAELISGWSQITYTVGGTVQMSSCGVYSTTSTDGAFGHSAVDNVHSIPAATDAAMYIKVDASHYYVQFGLSLTNTNNDYTNWKVSFFLFNDGSQNIIYYYMNGSYVSEIDGITDTQVGFYLDGAGVLSIYGTSDQNAHNHLLALLSTTFTTSQLYFHMDAHGESANQLEFPQYITGF